MGLNRKTNVWVSWNSSIFNKNVWRESSDGKRLEFYFWLVTAFGSESHVVSFGGLKIQYTICSHRQKCFTEGLHRFESRFLYFIQFKVYICKEIGTIYRFIFTQYIIVDVANFRYVIGRLWHFTWRHVNVKPNRRGSVNREEVSLNGSSEVAE